jgi:hypothetical protein
MAGQLPVVACEVHVMTREVRVVVRLDRTITQNSFLVPMARSSRATTWW